MTKKQALELFAETKAAVIEQYGRGDKPAMREAWCNFVDYLCTDRLITDYQARTWSNPF